MEIIALSYRIHPTDKYSCVCNQCRPIITQGKSMDELISNAIEATELLLELMIEGKLHKDDCPRIENVKEDKQNFVLYFNKETGKFIGTPAKQIPA